MTACGFQHGSDDVPCPKPAGHDATLDPHRVRSPYADGRWIDYDADGVEVARGGGWDQPEGLPGTLTRALSDEQHRRTRCLGVPPPGQLDEFLDLAIADEKITTDDADAVREFAGFLTEAGPPPGAPGTDPTRRRAAIAKYHDLVFGGPPPHPEGCPGCHPKETP